MEVPMALVLEALGAQLFNKSGCQLF